MALVQMSKVQCLHVATMQLFIASSHINDLKKLSFNIWKARVKKMLLQVKLGNVTLAFSASL